MAEISAGDIVRVVISGESGEQVRDLMTGIVKEPETADLLTALPMSSKTEAGEFGLVELAQEFIISAGGGVTTAGLIEGIKHIWKRTNQAGPLPPQTAESPSTPVEGTPITSSITVSVPSEGVTEITIRIDR